MTLNMAKFVNAIGVFVQNINSIGWFVCIFYTSLMAGSYEARSAPLYDVVRRV